MQSRSIAAQLHEGRVMITNSLKNQGVLALVAPFGYTVSVLQARLIKNTEAAELFAAKEDAETFQVMAKKRAKTCYDESREQYDRLKGVALLIMRGSSHSYLRAMLLLKDPPRRIAGYILAAQTFYRVAMTNEAIKAKFLAVGITEADFELAQELITIYERMCSEHRNAVGMTGLATTVQNEAIAEHGLWTRQYKRTAKYVLRKDPDTFESLLTG